MRLDLPLDGPIPLESLLENPPTNGHKPPAATPAAQATRPARPAAQPAPATPATPRSTDSDGGTEPATPSANPQTTRPASRLRPNRLQWRGRLAADPELKHSRSGIDFCTVRVLQDVFDTQRRALTQAVEVVMFRERAHDFAGTFRKGDYVEVVGELHIREWQDQAGAKHAAVNLHPSEEIALISRPQRTPTPGIA